MQVKQTRLWPKRNSLGLNSEWNKNPVELLEVRGVQRMERMLFCYCVFVLYYFVMCSLLEESLALCKDKGTDQAHRNPELCKTATYMGSSESPLLTLNSPFGQSLEVSGIALRLSKVGRIRPRSTNGIMKRSSQEESFRDFSRNKLHRF